MLIREQEKADYCLRNSELIVSVRDPQKPTDKLKKLLTESKKTGNVHVYKKDDGTQSFVYKGGVLSFYSNKIKEIYGEKVPTEILTDFWGDISWDGIAKEGNIELKNGKKPEKLIDRIIQISNIENKDLIIDFFGGSGTTAAVAYKMGKKFISCEMNDYFESKMLNRMKYTMFGNSGGIPSQRESGIVQYIELEQYDDIIDNLEVLDGIDYSKVDFGYIYEPDKNQINFRMENELSNPLASESKFDIFTSLLFHEGLELQTVNLEDEILMATVKDKYEKNCAVILGNDKAKISSKAESIKDTYSKIYANIQSPLVESIIAETFKGK